MKRDLNEKLSYFMKPDGTIRAVMPDQDSTFNARELHAFIASRLNWPAVPRMDTPCFATGKANCKV